MPLTREQKEKIIKELKENLQKQKSIVFVDFSGVESKNLFDLRAQLAETNCLLQVVKKTLLAKALEADNEKYFLEKIKEIKGQLALVFGLEDEIMPAKICFQFAKENKDLEILGGIIKNQKSKIKNQKYEFLTAEEVITLAQLPSREELLARIIASIKAPVSYLVNVLRGNIKGLLCVLNAIKSQ